LHPIWLAAGRTTPRSNEAVLALVPALRPAAEGGAIGQGCHDEAFGTSEGNRRPSDFLDARHRCGRPGGPLESWDGGHSLARVYGAAGLLNHGGVQPLAAVRKLRAASANLLGKDRYVSALSSVDLGAWWQTGYHKSGWVRSLRARHHGAGAGRARLKHVGTDAGFMRPGGRPRRSWRLRTTDVPIGGTISPCGGEKVRGQGPPMNGRKHRLRFPHRHARLLRARAEGAALGRLEGSKRTPSQCTRRSRRGPMCAGALVAGPGVFGVVYRSPPDEKAGGRGPYSLYKHHPGTHASPRGVA